MAPAGPRVQKPVGSAAWISTEKENYAQLVDQEMEEIEYPVRHEMDWLNEHMAEVFASNQFNLTDVFKTPGKLRGKTPRTARKRNVNENRIPLSEIFTTSHNQGDRSRNVSPARSPVKPTAAPITTAPSEPKVSPIKTKDTAENTSQPQYPDLTQNLNSFPQYNTDSGYHGMPDDEEDDHDDDVVLTQVQSETQTSTQPLEAEPVTANETRNQPQRQSVDRRTTAASFHSAQEDVRQRGETVEPIEEPMEEPVEEPVEAVNNETTPKQEKMASSTPQPDEKQPEAFVVADSAAEVEAEVESEVESESKPQAEPQTSPAKSSPVKQPAAPVEEEIHEKDDTPLDSLDDIGTPSDNSTPERPPIRKSSLSFASLPAREPLLKKSLGGSRISRTSHIDITRVNNAAGPSSFGRQTGGHRNTAVDEEPALDDDMDIDEGRRGAQQQDDIEAEADATASKAHTKSSTQRLHEKISMLGKLQPSRPTKSIPSVSGLSSTHVAYPELPAASAKSEVLNQESREASAPEPMAIDGDDWIKPIESPQKSHALRSPKMDVNVKESTKETSRPYIEKVSVPRTQNRSDTDAARASNRNVTESIREKSSTPAYSSPQRPTHQKSASVSNTGHHASTTPVGSPAAERHDGPLSASKLKLQSIMRSAKGLFTNTGSVTAAARLEASSPDELGLHSYNRPSGNTARETQDRRPVQISSPLPRQEGRRTRSSTEREEKRKQKELEDRRREEEHAEKARVEERQKALQLKIAQERARMEEEERNAPPSAAAAPASSTKAQPLQRHQSREPEPSHETVSRAPSRMSVSQQQPKQNDRRPVKPTREALQKPKPQPVSIRVGSALSRQIPLASTSVASSGPEPSASVAAPPSASKPPTLKKKASNSSLHTASSNSSFKSSVSSQSQRKVQLANERKREQEEREARRREEQRRELERKRAAQQQEEARRQEMRSRAEAERRENAKKAAQIQAIEKRRQENARRLERQGSQQPTSERASIVQPERPLSQAARPASRLGSIQPFSRTINPPQPNPAKPPKRGLDEEASYRPAAMKSSTVQPSGESKRRKTEDEHNPMSAIRPTMAPPIRQSGIRKESMKPPMYGHGQTSMHQPGSSIFKTAQPQRPAHPMDMAKYASGKIPFAEPSNAVSQLPGHKTPGTSSSQRAPAKPSPNYPNGDNIHLPEIATDSEDEDSDAEMLPVPKWAQPKELENILRQQEGMEADSIFGPIAPFSLEETFKADKKIKKFRERTSSANWSGADGLTQEEIRRDLAERQRLRLNGGWTFDS
ncbi:inner centromere protein-related protein pic1 [Aspergillus udagawae]|nr:inner centromere protein-related protein pic1 [Aspergillus udagawae]